MFTFLQRHSWKIENLQASPCKNIPVVLVTDERSLLQLEVIPLSDEQIDFLIASKSSMLKASTYRRHAERPG
jgi:hypothetical protein